MKAIDILFVDDEPSLLDGIRRITRRKTDSINARFSNSGHEALDALDDESVDIIITDMRMPEMSGVELLKRVKDLYPHTIRFILSGYSDKGKILESVGLTHQFFSKPCDFEQLFEAINHTRDLYQKLNNPSLQETICCINNLPSPPSTYLLLEEELKKSDPDFDHIAEIVRKDASTSAKLLQMVNSAFFGIGSEITSVEQASQLLGVENLKSLVLSIGISNEAFSGKIDQSVLEKYVSHSTNVALISQNIASMLTDDTKTIQTAFTVGLLHDIGKLIQLLRTGQKAFDSLGVEWASEDSLRTQKLESEVFGANHAELGAALLALWGLPPKIVRAVFNHHTPEVNDGEEISLSSIAHIGNAVAWAKRESMTPEALLESELLDECVIVAANLEAKMPEILEQTTV